jgi:hypothetical protein
MNSRSMTLPVGQTHLSRSIARGDWKRFLDEFSRRHEGWLASIRIREREVRQDRVVARELPLERVDLDEFEDRIEIHLGNGETRRILHFVENPSSLHVELDTDGAEWGLEIGFANGIALLRFRCSWPSEMVDGIARPAPIPE